MAGENYELLVGREEATRRLRDRIRLGEELSQVEIRSEVELRTAKEKYFTWDEYNVEMLRRMFSNSSVTDGYAHSYGFGIVGVPFSQEVNEFRNDVRRKTRRLQSVVEKLELVPETASVAKGRTAGESEGQASEGDRRRVFVVHGRDLKTRDGVFAFLQSIGLSPLEWGQAVKATRKASPYVGEVLDAAFSGARAVVVLMTPDDEGRLREQFQQRSDPPHEKSLTPQARANVLFEAGMAMGRFPDRTVLVEIGSLRPFSDIGGRHVVRLDNTSQTRQQLAERLKTAGCAVDLGGTGWHTAGKLELDE